MKRFFVFFTVVVVVMVTSAFVAHHNHLTPLEKYEKAVSAANDVFIIQLEALNNYPDGNPFTGTAKMPGKAVINCIIDRQLDMAVADAYNRYLAEVGIAE